MEKPGYVTQVGSDANADGTIAVRPAFWTAELVSGATTTQPFMVRADLLLEGDPRLTAIARDKEMSPERLDLTGRDEAWPGAHAVSLRARWDVS